MRRRVSCSRGPERPSVAMITCPARISPCEVRTSGPPSLSQRNSRRALMDADAEARGRPRQSDGEFVGVEVPAAAIEHGAVEALRTEGRDRVARDPGDWRGRSRSGCSAPRSASPSREPKRGLWSASMTPARKSQAMAKRTTSARTSAFASSAMSHRRLACSKPNRSSSQRTSRRWPEWICPPLRPDAALATRSASTSTTSAPASARWRAAERPV